MTLVGKILTVLILIMSISFMMIAVTVFAAHRNWHDLAMKHKDRIEELSQTNVRLRAEQQRADDRLAIEQAARRFALAALQSRLEQLDSQLSQREQQLTSLQGRFDTDTETLNQNTMNLTNLTNEVQGLRDEIRVAQLDRDVKFTTVVALTDSISGLQGSLLTFREQEVALRERVSRMKLVMDAHELTEFTPVVDIPPRVDGIVTKVGEKVLVEVSIGSDDGLRKGHTLEVFRNQSYLGRVVVKTLAPDRAVCEIIPEYRKGIIKRGDRVATKLS
ncbi:MAG: hypothetical protein CMJ64_19190 [Planctomycetaceae bacterium]|nr:hypothetical protein [Planctomycetaceae bacterium]